MKINGLSESFNSGSLKQLEKSQGPSFGQYLKNALNSVNDAQIKSDEETIKLMTGESEDIHQALIAAEEARIQMELIVQVRNKLLESYQEINRMQV